MDDKTRDLLILEIESAFSGVNLGSGTSWREAQLIDDYGSYEERKMARSKDETEDWQKIPLALIGDLKYQSVLSFLDVAGLKYYLPICLIYFLKEGEKSDSAITASLISTLTDEKRVAELISHLSNRQKECVNSFLVWIIESMAYSAEREAMRKVIKAYWSGV